MIVAGSSFLAFGICNVHEYAAVTEGGVLGMVLLLNHWLHISPAVSWVILNAVCYYIGWRQMGKQFIIYSAISTLSFSVSYAIFDGFAPVWPAIQDMPLPACIIGALFVGIGAGVCVRVGCAPGGDDALALALSNRFKCKIERIYLITDMTVLLLSLSYIPLTRIIYSILTVILSGRVIGWIQRCPDIHKRIRKRN